MRKMLPVLGLMAMLCACTDDYGPDQSGRTITRAEFDGHWRVISYWADWCAPCRQEVPTLNALQKTYPQLRLYGVSYDHLQGADLQRTVTALGMQYPVLVDDPAIRLGLPRPVGLPTTYVINPQGQQVGIFTGERAIQALAVQLSGWMQATGEAQ